MARDDGSFAHAGGVNGEEHFRYLAVGEAAGEEQYTYFAAGEAYGEAVGEAASEAYDPDLDSSSGYESSYRVWDKVEMPLLSPLSQVGTRFAPIPLLTCTMPSIYLHYGLPLFTSTMTSIYLHQYLYIPPLVHRFTDPLPRVGWVGSLLALAVLACGLV